MKISTLNPWILARSKYELTHWAISILTHYFMEKFVDQRTKSKFSERSSFHWTAPIKRFDEQEWKPVLRKLQLGQNSRNPRLLIAGKTTRMTILKFFSRANFSMITAGTNSGRVAQWLAESALASEVLSSTSTPWKLFFKRTFRLKICCVYAHSEKDWRIKNNLPLIILDNPP